MTRELSGQEYEALLVRHCQALRGYVAMMKKNRTLTGSEIATIRNLLSVQEELIKAERKYKEEALKRRSALERVIERN